MISSLFLVGLLGTPLVTAATIDLRAAAKPKTINSTIESGINTECKTCPWSLCPNKLAFGSGDAQVLTCWTQGTNVNGDDTWLKTSDGCYITQWDLVEYAGDYTKDLPYCGKIAQKITKKSSKTIYNTECNLSPSFQEKENHVKMYAPQVPLTVTCRATEDTADVLGNTVWYKTLSNCYVPGAQIEPVDTKGLDSCGPVPFLEKKMREPDTETASKRALAVREPSDLAVVEKRWLYSTQIGFDKGPCTQKAAKGSKVQRNYKYGAYVIVQCATFGDSDPSGADRTIYLLTTDFCYLNDNYTDPQLIDEEIRAERYPACELFVDKSV